MTIQRIAAFTTDPSGGNPAGVSITDTLPSDAEMLKIAADIGFSETVFAAPTSDGFKVRYFSPEAEVSFCGHATIALGQALGDSTGPGHYNLHTAPGLVGLDVVQIDGGYMSTLTSVDPSHERATDELLNAVLATLGWSIDTLGDTFAPATAFAGARHLLLAVPTREQLAHISYDFKALKSVMLNHDLTTINILWQESKNVFHARNLFPVGGVIEDPATGAAAAAFGGFLRDTNLIAPPSTITVYQGEDMGRPSTLTINTARTGGIKVSGFSALIA